ncbi:uncharacterized protein PG998_001168 [Apiospora kogelbergensis]|uniref:feruloyl esterase n=1 Tax=Apiospora kogelbergensis TaxID=1337665 RepID=A0AAW0QVH9_9PEZI
MHIICNVLNALVLATVATASSSGCGVAPPIPLGQRHNATLSSADLAINNRTFMYWLPPNYNPAKPNPLILSFHGGGVNGDRQADQDSFADPFFNQDHVVVYPQGLVAGAAGVEPITVWQGIRLLPCYWDDVAFVLALLDHLERELLCIDPTRVYAAGKSMGGGLSDILACDARSSARFAAIAPVAGSYWARLDPRLCSTPDSAAAVPVPACPGKRACPMPVMAFHGRNDTTAPIGGGPITGLDCMPPVQRWVETWAARDGLDPSSPSAEKLPSGDNATVYRYGRGDDGGEEKGLVTFVMPGDHVAHDWPTTVDYGGTQRVLEPGQGPANFNGTAMIMDFFRKYKTP